MKIRTEIDELENKKNTEDQWNKFLFFWRDKQNRKILI
jgi:hypothetical protein